MEKSRALPIIFAILIALAGFTLILAATARFLPAFLGLAGSNVPALAFLLVNFLLVALFLWRGRRHKTRI